MSPSIYKTDQASQALIIKAKQDIEFKKKLASATLQQCKLKILNKNFL